MNILLEIQYLPPVQYFSKFCKYDKIVIADTEIFQKQSFRNRCIITGANNLQVLIIPLRQGKTGALITEVEIDNSRRWQREHWHSIKSAYGKAPYFEHYAPYFEPFYTKEYNLLFEFDLELIGLCMKLLKIPTEKLQLSSSTTGKDTFDFRSRIHPKAKLDDSEFTPQPYIQVFNERSGWVPNLSILDLIFNLGPGGMEVLLGSSVSNNSSV
jgi:hypothetical protein